MKTVGISEFQENLFENLKNSAPLAITRRGKTAAFWLPVPPWKTEEEWVKFDRAAARADQFVAELDGMTEEETGQDFEKWRTAQKHKRTEKDQVALYEAAKRVREMLSSKGITEDEIVQEFDQLRKHGRSK